MNILFFTHEKSFGGASRALITLIDELLKKDYNIYVVVPFKNAKVTSELKKRNVKIISCFYSWWQIPTNVNIIKKIMFRISYKFNYFSKIILVSKIKKLNIDIIHSNTSVIDIGAIVSKKLNIKHVWHFREFTGDHLKFIKETNKVYDFINNNTDKIIYISKAIQKFYEKNIDKKLGVLAYDGVSEKYLAQKSDVNKDKIIFLLAATLQESKGHRLVIEACNILNKKNITNYKLYLAGGDPTGYFKLLNEMIENYKLQSNVEYIGFIDNITEFRKSVDVELMCSTSEAFGLSTVEAMLASSIVIGSNSGATPEIIKDGKNGFLFEKGNYEDLANKMEYVIKNNKIIKNISDNARKYARNNFSSSVHAQRIEQIYKQLL